MNVLVVGGAGHVGSILKPALEARHNCRYLDLRPVPDAVDRSVVGSLTDPVAVRRAMEGMDACIQLAMYQPRRGEDNVDVAYDIHVKGMHRVLEAAVACDCRRIIYASTLSVYRRSRPPEGSARDETVPPDASRLYGFTKRLGEDVCQAFAALHPELSILALRMVLPRNERQWAEPLPPGRDGNYRTGPDDLRRAYLAALDLNGHTGFDAISICSDVDGRYLDLTKARAMLGWIPHGA